MNLAKVLESLNLIFLMSLSLLALFALISLPPELESAPSAHGKKAISRKSARLSAGEMMPLLHPHLGR